MMQSPYPMGVNSEAMKEVKKAKKKEKKEQERAALQGVPALRDDPDRQRFVIKTYGIVAAQLAFTALVCGIVLSSDDAKEWIRDHYYLHYVALIFGITLMCVLLCC